MRFVRVALQGGADVTVHIGWSALDRKCVQTPITNIFCAEDAGNRGNRVNEDFSDAADTFNISVTANGQVCAQRTDSPHCSWMDHGSQYFVQSSTGGATIVAVAQAPTCKVSALG